PVPQAAAPSSDRRRDETALQLALLRGGGLSPSPIGGGGRFHSARYRGRRASRSLHPADGKAIPPGCAPSQVEGSATRLRPRFVEPVSSQRPPESPVQ